jgi:hypothetical protein
LLLRFESYRVVWQLLVFLSVVRKVGRIETAWAVTALLRRRFAPNVAAAATTHAASLL